MYIANYLQFSATMKVLSCITYVHYVVKISATDLPSQLVFYRFLFSYQLWESILQTQYVFSTYLHVLLRLHTRACTTVHTYTRLYYCAVVGVGVRQALVWFDGEWRVNKHRIAKYKLVLYNQQLLDFAAFGYRFLYLRGKFRHHKGHVITVIHVIRINFFKFTCIFYRVD